MRRGLGARCATLLGVAALLASSVPNASAQLKGHYLPGFTGLQNGTQPPPGVTIPLPMYYYTTEDIVDDEGNSLFADPDINSFFIGLGATWVTNAELLGANYGVSVIPLAFIQSRIEGNSVDVSNELSFSDIYVQPLYLGWHASKADYVAGYGFFAPTGKWELGGRDNAGLGMWSHLFQAGTTVHLNGSRKWSVSTLASFEIHSDKKDTDIKVGDILTLEGGIGRSIYAMRDEGGTPTPSVITTVGAAYYAQWKVTADTGPLLTPLLEGHEDRVYALGIEGNVVLVGPGLVFVVRGLPEFGARNRTQGWAFVFSVAYSFD